jgi:hypothetical protein
MDIVDTPPVFNPFLPEFHTNPHAHYHALRRNDPVHWSFLGVWLLTRHADVVSALRDQRFSADPRQWNGYAKRYLRHSNGRPGPLATLHSKWLLGIDPPDHTRLRGLTNKAFTPQVAERLRPDIHRLVARLLDRVATTGRMDVIGDLAYPLPLLVIAKMLGVPEEDCEQLRVWSLELNPSFDPLMPLEVLAHADHIVLEMNDYFRRQIQARRREPRDDLLSALVAAGDHGDRFSEDELLAACVLLFWAGHETTVNLIGNGIYTLLEHPSELARLRADASLAPAAVEEMLRFESPVQLTYRTARQDLQFGGREIRQGQQVILSLGGANRDPEAFPDPDRFDIARRDNHHVAFSYGIHFCVGAALARVQAQIAVVALLDRLGTVELEPRPLEWHSNILVRGLKTLPVTFEPRAVGY